MGDLKADIVMYEHGGIVFEPYAVNGGTRKSQASSHGLGVL